MIGCFRNTAVLRHREQDVQVAQLEAAAIQSDHSMAASQANGCRATANIEVSISSSTVAFA